MPYSAEHKKNTRATIIETARTLFNIHGFRGVTIGMIMKQAGLTHGGFYNHFDNKEALYAAAVKSFLGGRGAQWREEAGIDPSRLNPEMAQHMLDSYLSNEHLEDMENQCPMIALPSDVARASPDVQQAYQELLTAMVWLFENTLDGPEEGVRQRALSMAALCVGGMVLARTLPDSGLAIEVRDAALKAASDMREVSTATP
ncbi:TetR/AcrR family transcriptional regulator [Sneathiella aquimaris]|uniref:TetR/AcrR family transcriptional regulator n=1 Tax=Sneathiella aquimaris TaxID=2599305 RepID=UPI001469CBE2|nr:TetR/AcrR family transcriptional regulator [Sneathiella aquimaris]